MVFDKLFSWWEKKDTEPAITFGRYSDNNKSIEKIAKWTLADALFSEQKYAESIEAFFEYLADDGQQNVLLEKTGGVFQFQLYQGSKLVRGRMDDQRISASVALARMREPAIPVMRRLLEMNFNLYYSRYTLLEDQICMHFDTSLRNASPNKLYYGLKEIATRSDKQDDLLLNEFAVLEATDTAHIDLIDAREKEIKYLFLEKWIRETLEHITALDQEKFSGGISYMLLTLVFRIDYLVAPQGKTLSELEKIASAYYGKEDKSAPQRNPPMIESFNSLLKKDKEVLFSQLFRSRYTFAIVATQNFKLVSEKIVASLQNMEWYRDNNFPDIANKVMEYGFAFCQYSYSLPRPLTELFRLFMQVNYSEYFSALGFTTVYYNEKNNQFDGEEISEKIESLISFWQPKYPALNFRTKMLRFDTLIGFNQRFLQETAQLVFD